MRGVLKRMGKAGVATVHGFRATFSTWCAETTHTPEELREACLAHGASKVVAAYQRGDLLNKRRELMNAWAVFAGSHGRADNVVDLRKSA